MVALRRSVIIKGDRAVQGYVRWERPAVAAAGAVGLRREEAVIKGMPHGYEDDRFTVNLARAGEVRTVELGGQGLRGTPGLPPHVHGQHPPTSCTIIAVWPPFLV